MGRFSSISRFLSATLSRRISGNAPPKAVRFYCNQSPARRSGPLTQYQDLVKEGKLQHDPNQEKVALELENLLGRLQQYERDMEEYHVKLAEWESRRENERYRLLVEEAESKQRGDMWASVNKQRSKLAERWMFRKKTEKIELGVGKWVSYLNREKKLDTVVGRRPTAPPAPKGLYLFGNVGSGKTMLMDMFYSSTEGIVKHRRRYHFHEAMLEINAHMHQIWKKQVEEKPFQSSISSWIRNLPFDSNVKEWLVEEEKYKQEMQIKNILPAVADKFLIDGQEDHRGASILCFDEIQTVDVFAIVALSGIVSRLLSTGTILVATSNRAPEDLNQDGMHREIFLKFLDKLREHCDNILIGSEVDYRRLIAQRFVPQTHFFWPLDGNAETELERKWVEMTNESQAEIVSEIIPVMFGRTLEVPESCNGIAKFTFEHLCGWCCRLHCSS